MPCSKRVRHFLLQFFKKYDIIPPKGSENMKRKNGLILEGGAMRGLFTCGVLDVFMENGITFDGVSAVSAGACFGCNIKSGQKGRALRYNLRFCNDKKYGSMRSLLTSGDYYNVDYCYRYVPEEVDIFDRKAFYENPMEFYIAQTDIESGKPVYYRCEKEDPRLMDHIRASASLPFFASIVEIDGKKLMDGGISDSIPLRYLESIGYDRNLVILTQPRGYVKKKTGMMGLIKLKYRKYPNLIRALEKRHEMYNETTEYVFEREKQGNVFVICPDEKLPISRIEHDPKILQKTYDLGVMAGKKYLEQVKAFLGESI